MLGLFGGYELVARWKVYLPLWHEILNVVLEQVIIVAASILHNSTLLSEVMDGSYVVGP